MGDAHHCSGPPVSEMTVSSGTLNPNIPYHHSFIIPSIHSGDKTHFGKTSRNRKQLGFVEVWCKKTFWNVNKHQQLHALQLVICWLTAVPFGTKYPPTSVSFNVRCGRDSGAIVL